MPCGGNYSDRIVRGSLDAARIVCRRREKLELACRRCSTRSQENPYGEPYQRRESRGRISLAPRKAESGSGAISRGRERLYGCRDETDGGPAKEAVRRNGEPHQGNRRECPVQRRRLFLLFTMGSRQAESNLCSEEGKPGGRGTNHR